MKFHYVYNFYAFGDKYEVILKSKGQGQDETKYGQ